MIDKKIIVCDLDGTLAESKSVPSLEMAELICGLLAKHYLAIVSGGSFEQFKKQFLSHLSCPEDSLKNLYIFPTMGGACYVYKDGDWEKVYEEGLDFEERETIKRALKAMMAESEMSFDNISGDLVDDRGTQITFSALGQDAPLELKKDWDTDHVKRIRLVEILKSKIPQFEIRIGGATSIDVTKKGIDKAFAVKKIKEMLGAQDEEIVFIGDALYKGGNDAPVKNTEVDYIQPANPQETIAILREYL